MTVVPNRRALFGHEHDHVDGNGVDKLKMITYAMEHDVDAGMVDMDCGCHHWVKRDRIVYKLCKTGAPSLSSADVVERAVVTVHLSHTVVVQLATG